MKRKSIILLSSILAGSLLVGGAFAAYAVTDNADPFGINVTPGNTDKDDTTYVTLEWGTSTNLENVGLLKVGEERKVGVVSLVSTPAHEGKFTLSIQDQTTFATEEEKNARTDYLLDYLEVDVYAGSLTLEDLHPTVGDAPTPVRSIVKSTVKQGYHATKSIEPLVVEGTPSGTPYTIFLVLDDSASPAFDQMGEDKVRLTVDWGKKDDDDEATGSFAYYTNTNDWAEVAAYAWKGEKINADYPGVEMTPSYNAGLYEVFIPSGMEYIIFNNNKKGDGEEKTDNISLAGYNANTAPYWNGAAWAAKPEKIIVSEVTATVNGSPIELTDKKPPLSTDKAQYQIQLAQGATIQFKEGNTTIHYYHWDGEQSKTVDDGTQYVAPRAGIYTFYLNSDNEMYYAAPEFYLVGVFNSVEKWGITADSVQLIPNLYATNEYQLAEPIALTENDQLKIRSVLDEDAWYPAGETPNYEVPETADYNIYFRPAGGVTEDDWHYGFFCVTKVVTELP